MKRGVAWGLRAGIVFSLLAVVVAPLPAHGKLLYVSISGGGIQSQSIQKVDPSGAFSTFVVTPGNAAGLAFDSAGNLFATVGNDIIEYAPDGTPTTFASGLSNPQGLAFDSSGNLYVANFSSSTVVKFVGPTPSTFASFGGGAATPSGLAFDTAGNLYVATDHDNTIHEVTPAGVVSTFGTTGLNGPVSLAFDTSGNLYASNFNNNTIEKFTAGGAGSLFANSGLSEPHGLAFDALGNLYVANSGNDTIEKFTSAGIGSLYAGGMRVPNDLAFEVPEPSAAALLLAAMPLALPRRRRPREALRS